MSAPAPIKVLVVGASGFIGRAIVDRMVAQYGASAVVAGIRRPLDLFGTRGVEMRLSDATDPASLEAASTDITHLINCVAGSTATILASARASADVAQLRRLQSLVFFSSIAVYGTAEGSIDENAPLGRGTNHYGEAKRAAETIVRNSGTTGLPIVILRPALVYGPGSALWTTRIAGLLRAGRLGDLGAAGEGLCNLVHVRDVAAAAVQALKLEKSDGTVFNLAAPQPRSWNAYFRDLGRALDLAPRTISARRLKQEALLAYPLRAMEIAASKLNFTSPEPITPSLSRLFGQRVKYDSTRASVLLPGGWTTYEQGIAESAAWVRDKV